MSVEILDNLKRQARQLSAQEIENFVNYLQEIKESDEKDLGLAGESNAEMRRLHMQWLKDNRTKYAGKYVALDGAKVVGIGKTRHEAAGQANDQNVRNAFVTYVYPLDYVGEVGGW